MAYYYGCEQRAFRLKEVDSEILFCFGRLCKGRCKLGKGLGDVWGLINLGDDFGGGERGEGRGERKYSTNIFRNLAQLVHIDVVAKQRAAVLKGRAVITEHIAVAAGFLEILDFGFWILDFG